MKVNPGLLTAAQRAARTLTTEFNEVDGLATGVRDRFLSPAELKASVANETLSPELRQAAEVALGEYGRLPVNTPAGRVEPDTAVFDLFDTITAPGLRDQQISMDELNGVLAATSAQGWTGALTFEGSVTEQGQSLPGTRNIEVLSMDNRQVQIRYQGQLYTLNRAQIEREYSPDGFATTRRTDEEFLTHDGAFLVKFSANGTNNSVSDLNLYLKLRKPTNSYLVWGDFQRVPQASTFASIDPASSPADFVGLTATENNRSFVATSKMPVMPHESHWARYDGLDVPTSPAAML